VHDYYIPLKINYLNVFCKRCVYTVGEGTDLGGSEKKANFKIEKT
jgi:hypothetical protein